MIVYGIDPGTEESALVAYRSSDGEIGAMTIAPNHDIRALLMELDRATVAIEMIASYGMAVGREVFETCVWIGRFLEAAERHGHECHRVYRQEVKLHLCASPRAKDANVRQALIDRYGPTKQAAIGRKKSPGPLYGMRSHMWPALAVAITFADTHDRGEDGKRAEAV